MAGWIKIHRDIKDHWIWQNEKYFRWWMTILLSVNYEEKKFPINSTIFICNPGESFRSIESWSSEFGCAKKTLLRFFDMLKKDNMIETKTVGNGNRRKHLLTVLNWQKYQQVETRNYTERKPETTPKVTPNKKDKNNKKEKKEEKNIEPENFKNFQHVVSFFDSKFFNQDKWLDCYDKLIRIDKHTEDEILKVVSHFRSPGNWWMDQGNFNSLLKLRQKNKEGIQFMDYFKAKMRGTKSVNNNLKINDYDYESVFVRKDKVSI